MGTVRLEVSEPEVVEHERITVETITYTLDKYGIAHPRTVVCLSLRYQLAQKLHAVTEVFEHGHNQRFRDLIDILLLRDLLDDLAPSAAACREIFGGRGKHPWPPELVVPAGWDRPYARLAQDTRFTIEDVQVAAGEVRRLIAELDAVATGPPR